MSGFRPYSDEEAAANAAAAPPDADRLLHGPRERTRRVYRVTAAWEDYDGQGPRRQVRHYQTRQAAERRARMLREGLPEQPGEYDHLNGEAGGVPAVPPASSVTVEPSDPVTWPS